MTGLVELIEKYEESCVKDREAYDNQTYEDLSDVVIAKAATGADIGFGYLMLGDCERGREWLTTVARNCLIGFEQKTEAVLNRGGEFNGAHWDKLAEPLSVAVLSRSDDVLTSIVSEARETIDTIPENATAERAKVRKHKYEALMSVMINENDSDEVVARFREKIEDQSAGHDGKFFLPVVTALEGIVTHDEARFTEGVQNQLQVHEEFAVEPPRSAREMEWRMDTLAATLVELAHRRGLIIQIDSEYVPPCVFLD